MDISVADYEQKRHIFELCNWINQKLHSLEEDANFEALYYERIGANWKRLLEEAIPVSILGLYLYRSWLEVCVQCFADNRHYDAVIETRNPSTNYSSEFIKVEVTTTEDDISAMRRQALSRDGFVHFTGTVKREGRRIISESAFVDIEQECVKIVQLTLERIEHKLKNEYDNQTAILVYVTTQRKLYHRHRADLVEKIKYQLRERNPKLYGIFICYSQNLGVDGVINLPQYDFAT